MLIRCIRLYRFRKRMTSPRKLFNETSDYSLLNTFEVMDDREPNSPFDSIALLQQRFQIYIYSIQLQVLYIYKISYCADCRVDQQWYTFLHMNSSFMLSCTNLEKKKKMRKDYQQYGDFFFVREFRVGVSENNNYFSFSFKTLYEIGSCVVGSLNCSYKQLRRIHESVFSFDPTTIVKLAT